MGGATTAKEYAIGALRMENDIAKAEGEGNTELANMLRQQLAAVQQANQISNTELQQKANVGDTRAQRELDEYYAFMKTVEGSSPGEAFPFLISIISGLLLYGCASFSQGCYNKPGNIDPVVRWSGHLRYAWQLGEPVMALSLR